MPIRSLNCAPCSNDPTTVTVAVAMGDGVRNVNFDVEINHFLLFLVVSLAMAFSMLTMNPDIRSRTDSLLVIDKLLKENRIIGECR